MTGATVDVDGAVKLRKSLAKAGADVKDFKEVHGKIGDYVGATAAGRAPRRSGSLAASWRPGATKTQAVVRFGNASVPYANAIHWGTGPRPGKRGPHNIPGRQFATSAAAATEPTWLGWYWDELNKILAKIEGAPTK